jgi:TolA-binding protein
MTNLSSFAASGNLYTVHSSSYKVQQQAAADVKNLVAMGYDAFFIQVDVKSKGKWFRVYVGKYDSKEKARLVAEEMMKKKVISEYFIFPVSADQDIQDKGKKISRENLSRSVHPEKKIVVIANIDSKRYHLPGMPFYNKVKKHHRVLFNSEEEAIKAGYYKAGGSSTLQLQAKQAEPAIDKKKARSGHVEIGQKKQPNPIIEKQNVIITKTKTAEKVQQIPHALVLKKESDKAKKTEPIPAEIEEANSGLPLYDKALGELKEKNYEKALVTFKEFVARDDTTNELGERALRHMADCHFFLGEKGSKEHLAIAVQFYKNTLQSFPDEKKENALTYFRLAKTYEYLKNNSDALKNYENLLIKYPNAAYVSEASFKIGELLHQTGKFNQAADKLIAYLIKYRGGSFAKQAFYLVADCHYKMQQSASAEIWFRDAQKKWPDLTGIPKNVVTDMGQHKFSLRRYDEAINVYSFFANLYPDDEKLKEVLLLLANAYKAATQVSAALTIYNLIIDRYPESKEAQESIMAMASLGIDKPGVKIFSALRNIHYYRNPLEAYNILLMKNPTREIAQIALLRKGDALHKLKQDKKAADVYLEFLNLYPQSKLVNDAQKGLKLASITLIDEYYHKKDYLAVADIYFKAYRAVPLQADEYDIVNKIAISLKENNLTDDYVKLLKDYKNVSKDDKITSNVMFSIAEGEMTRNNYDEAEKIFGELMAQQAIKKTTLMSAIRKDLAEIAYRKGLYDKAITEFDAVVKSGQDIKNPGLTFWHYAASLKAKNENTRSLQNYLKAVEYLSQDKPPAMGFGEAYKETGDLYFKDNNFKNSLDMYNKALTRSSNPDLKSWSLFNVGQSYLKMDNNTEAKKKFDQIKTESGPEGFWTKIVDYYVDDQKWWDKYGEHLKK